MLDWETLTEGERFGPFQYTVAADVVERYRAVVGDYESSAGAPPALLTFAFLGLIDSKYAPRPGTIHAQQSLSFLAPLRLGAVLTVTGVLEGKEVKRGRRYFTVEATAVDELGVEVARSKTVGLCP